MVPYTGAPGGAASGTAAASPSTVSEHHELGEADEAMGIRISHHEGHLVVGGLLAQDLEQHMAMWWGGPAGGHAGEKTLCSREPMEPVGVEKLQETRNSGARRRGRRGCRGMWTLRATTERLGNPLDAGELRGATGRREVPGSSGRSSGIDARGRCAG